MLPSGEDPRDTTFLLPWLHLWGRGPLPRLPPPHAVNQLQLFSWPPQQPRASPGPSNPVWAPARGGPGASPQAQNSSASCRFTPTSQTQTPSQECREDLQSRSLQPSLSLGHHQVASPGSSGALLPAGTSKWWGTWWSSRRQPGCAFPIPPHPTHSW